MSNLRNDQEYGQCVSCGRVFVISLFSTSWCNYDRSGLQRIGRVYPVGVKVGA
jgi:hypothetical protein